ncbi:hypothetical protein D3C78_1304990 [compost metagenome]
MAVYGSVSKASDVNTLFNSISVGSGDNGQDIFAKALEKITHGASNGNLAEAGAVKLGSNLYVVIDKNHNQHFDQDDMVFALGDKDIYQVANDLHYQAPAIAVNGVSQHSVELV